MKQRTTRFRSSIGSSSWRSSAHIVDDFVRVRAPELRRNVARRMLVESMLKHLVYTVEVYWRRRLLPALRAAGIHIVDYETPHRGGTSRSRRALRRCRASRAGAAFVRRLPPIPAGCQSRYEPDGQSDGCRPVSGVSCCESRMRCPLSCPSTRGGAHRGPPLLTETGRFKAMCGSTRWSSQICGQSFPTLNLIAAHRFRLLREVDVFITDWCRRWRPRPRADCASPARGQSDRCARGRPPNALRRARRPRVVNSALPTVRCTARAPLQTFDDCGRSLASLAPTSRRRPFSRGIRLALEATYRRSGGRAGARRPLSPPV